MNAIELEEKRKGRKIRQRRLVAEWKRKKKAFARLNGQKWKAFSIVPLFSAMTLNARICVLRGWVVTLAVE